jgi:hypothetical protein
MSLAKDMVTGPGLTSVVRTRPSCVRSALAIVGDEVCNEADETLGRISDIMLDLDSGAIRYAVLSTGGFDGMGDRFVAIPWSALRPDPELRRFVLDVDVGWLRKAPGFDETHWRAMAWPVPTAGEASSTTSR